MPGVRGTWWAAYNGYNEWLNYERGRTTNNRLESLWFGQAGTDNNRRCNWLHSTQTRYKFPFVACGPGQSFGAVSAFFLVRFSPANSVP